MCCKLNCSPFIFTNHCTDLSKEGINWKFVTGKVLKLNLIFIQTVKENFLIVGGKHREQEDELNGNFTPKEAKGWKGTEGVSMAGRKRWVGQGREVDRRGSGEVQRGLEKGGGKEVLMKMVAFELGLHTWVEHGHWRWRQQSGEGRSWPPKGASRPVLGVGLPGSQSNSTTEELCGFEQVP